MAKKPESRLQQRIQNALKAEYGNALWCAKIYVGPFQQAGIPDLLVCCNGKFIALEVKLPGEEPSKIQEKTMTDIRNAGGHSCVVTTVKEALDAVETAISRTETRRRVRSGTGG